MIEPVTLSVIMPVLNEEENLPVSLALLEDHLPRYVQDFEILVVDDGSTDSSVEIASRFPHVRIIRHPANRGPGSGVYTGLEHACKDLIIFIPADLAMDLKQLPVYLEAARRADIVVGRRSDRRDYSLARKLVSFVNIGLIQLLFGMPQKQFNYIHMYRRHIFQKVWPETTGVFITAEIMIQARDAGYVLEEVDITYVPRAAGQASCGKPIVILRTVRDLFAFWLRWVARRYLKLNIPRPPIVWRDGTTVVVPHRTASND